MPSRRLKNIANKIAKKLTVWSTLTDDVIVDEYGHEIQAKAGGPGAYITAALDQEGIDYKFYHGPRLKTYIQLRGGGEFGRVPDQVSSRPIGGMKPGDWAVVSTLLDEWNPAGVSKLGHLFVDIQGYVRDGKDFGKKKHWPELAQIANSIFCLKGTKEEMDYLDKNILDGQRRRLLVITHGKKGAQVFYKGEEKLIPAAQVENLTDTIGAGDTFFGFFIAAIMKGNSPFVAAEYASEKTSQFLINKNVSDRSA